MIVQPQELEVWYLLPALRRELAKQLKLMKIPQKGIAMLLGVSEAAVSQYFKEKRAKKIVFNNEILNKIKLSAMRIAKKSNIIKEMQFLCKEFKKNKLLCKIHKEYSKTCNCGVCWR